MLDQAFYFGGGGLCDVWFFNTCIYKSFNFHCLLFFFSFITKPPRNISPFFQELPSLSETFSLKLPFLVSWASRPLSFLSPLASVLIHQVSDLFLVFPHLAFLGHLWKTAASSSVGSSACLGYLFPYLYANRSL